jgi:hypothetical protein
MNDLIGARAPGWFRIVAALGLIWNLIGVFFFLVQAGMVSAPGGAEPAMSDPMPAWAMGAFAIAVFGATLGCIGLLMLKRWSRSLLLISLLAILAQDLWAFVLRAHAADEMADGGKLGLTIAVSLIAILLLWLAHTGVKRGWLA